MFCACVRVHVLHHFLDIQMCISICNVEWCICAWRVWSKTVFVRGTLDWILMCVLFLCLCLQINDPRNEVISCTVNNTALDWTYREKLGVAGCGRALNCVAFREEFLLKTDSGYPKDAGIALVGWQWQAPGILSDFTPIGQLQQSPRLPVPGDLGRGPSHQSHVLKHRGLELQYVAAPFLWITSTEKCRRLQCAAECCTVLQWISHNMTFTSWGIHFTIKSRSDPDSKHKT